MSAAPKSYRIMLQLDRSVPFQALILNQVERRPARERSDWLRSLLVRGFLSECEQLRAIQTGGRSGVAPRATADTPIARPALAVVNDTTVAPRPATPSTETSDAADPPPALAFAALRKVIG